MALGDDVFQVNPREGSGSSFILGENTALKRLLDQQEVKQQEERVASKQLQDQLVGFVSSIKDALPLHTKELTDRYTKIVDWYKEKRAGGEKFKIGSDAQLEMQMKLGELQGASAKAKMWKNLALGATKEYAPDTHEQESYANLQKYLNETGVDDIDYKAIPSLSKQLDPDKYIKNVEANLQVQEDYDYKNPISIVNGVASVPMHQYKDIGAATKSVMDDETTDGQKFKKQAFSRFLKLPQKDQTAIITELSKENLSVQDDPKILEQKATEYMVKNSFKGKLLDKKDFKNVYDAERLAMLKSSLSAGNSDNKKEPVNFTPQDLGNTDQAANLLFGNDGNKKKVQISTPAEGENKVMNFNANQAITVNDGVKTVYDTKGKPIIGKVTSTISGDAVDGKIPVYAEIQGKSLTNIELYKSKGYSVESNDKGIIVMDKAGNVVKEMTKSEGNEQPTMTYYIPLRSAAKNMHSEFKKYKNTNTIGELNKHHGIDYSDLLKEDKKDNPPITVTTKEQFDKLPKGTSFIRNGKTFTKS